MKHKKKIIFISIGLILALGTWLYFKNSGTGKNDLFAQVKKGDFEITVFVAGELEAKNSVSIMGPQELQGLGIYQVKISDLIPEGSVVKKGDYIGELDKSELASKLKDANNDVQKYQTQLEQAKLDTALTLRQARDEILNLEFSVEEKKLTLEQSTYEPPATIKQIKMDMEKAIRGLDQAKKNYLLKKNQMVAKTQEVLVSLQRMQDKYEAMLALEAKFTITAPEGGMLIYYRDWDGDKRIVGSTIHAWNPAVATLPDLTKMISKTYVNEVDIRKIKQKQKVSISLDAYPEKKLTGVVSTVANIGEQNPKNDSKVFEVIIEMTQKDSVLLPAMTTGNNVIVDVIKNVLSVPLECIHTDEKNNSYVFLSENFSVVKKQVKPGKTNENFVIIEKGLAENDKLLLSTPENAADMKLVPLSK
ncbi:MAG: HlyD family secretion protein [Bacteroidia bacterium]|nr:HlyD family secretion protein [Bacteroidia bacterium]